MKKEQAYAFRQKLLTVHEKDIRRADRKTLDSEYEIRAGARLWVAADSSIVIQKAAADFLDYLQTSMGVAAALTENRAEADITVTLAAEEQVDLGDYACSRGFRIVTDGAGIRIVAHDDRGAAQALYYMEDLMTFAGAPVMELGTVEKKPAFSPQMVHSGYGYDEFPDNYLMRVAHEGRDAILVYTKGVNQSPAGYLDFNDLIARAASYGLDVYAYSVIRSTVSPEAPEAEEYYESTYGKLFRECPGLKGVTLVGEAVEFPSKDPNIGSGSRFTNNTDGIPSGKPSAGWWPCYDYPVWLNLLKKIIRKYKPDADIVFWTYNWGKRPAEHRLKLIEALPTDITLQATFEMAEQLEFRGAKGISADYSLRFEGPGHYFSSEAEVARRRGIKLYSMTNTGGRTWDFGVVPFEPMPYQWMRRYAAMLKAHDDWGLSGIMESHHYGFYPSFISKLSKHCFMEPRESMEKILEKILRSEFGGENYEKVDEALRFLSEAIRHYSPSRSDQYGAYRTGPSTPFCLSAVIPLPSSPGALYGTGICSPKYRNGCESTEWPVSMRIYQELEETFEMQALVGKALTCLDQVPAPNEKTDELRNMTAFMANTIQTGIHAKQWHLLCCRMNLETTREGLESIYDQMESLLLREIENAERTIPLVERDSRLGWEPSMLYMTDRWHLEWKIRQLRYVIDAELRDFRTAVRI